MAIDRAFFCRGRAGQSSEGLANGHFKVSAVPSSHDPYRDSDSRFRNRSLKLLISALLPRGTPVDRAVFATVAGPATLNLRSLLKRTQVVRDGLCQKKVIGA